MKKLSKRDYELINDAKEAIKNNYNFPNFTVGSAIECKNGHVYQGLNIYSMHGCCAELIALGSAFVNGERDFNTIVSINGESGEVISPCGNCRQILSDYIPNCYVIIKVGDELKKIKAKNLIPYSYHFEY